MTERVLITGMGGEQETQVQPTGWEAEPESTSGCSSSPAGEHR